MLQLIGDAYHGQGYSPSVIYNAKLLSPEAKREAFRILKITFWMIIPYLALF